MKTIFTIFKNDLKGIFRNIIVFVVIIGISILPALYAWFNIAANWDPYSSTGGIPFAICSNDKGYTFRALTINAGDKIVDGLKQNDKMGWRFVSQKEAVDGVNKGRYYAAVIIPENFTENLMSVTTGKFQQAKLLYYTNEKKNAIAPKITDKGVEAIQENVNSTYVSTATQIIATTLNISSGEITDNKEALAKKVIESLTTAKTDLKAYISIMDMLIESLDSVDSVLKSTKALLPDIQKALESSGAVSDEVKTSVKNIKDFSGQIVTSVEAVTGTAETLGESAKKEMDSAFKKIASGSKDGADNLKKVSEINEKLVTVYSKFKTAIETLEKDFDVDCSDLKAKITKAINRQNEIIKTIKSASSTVEKTGKLPSDIQKKIDTLMKEAKTDIKDVDNSFEAVKGSLNRGVTKTYSALDKVTDVLTSFGDEVPEVDSSITHASNSIAAMKKSFGNVKTYINDTIKKVDSLINKISDLKNSTVIEDIITPVIENPRALGEFVSSPVKTETEHFYHLDNYGTAMTPFYSSLAIWVGGIVLVAVMKTELTRRDLKKLPKHNSTQLYFGRYLLFFMLGQIQALIISLGDLYFLRIQCDNPVLFILSCMISSLVYTLIIYSLTITFSVIGKALSVIILVIQIAGAGGTFPIEVLPAPFQLLSPYLPFKYGVNILREAVAGADPEAYTKELLFLLAFIPFALLLGTVLRKPCIGITEFFNKRCKESDILE